MTVLPVPTLDHVVVNVRDRIDEGLETYRRLGFALTPRGYHTLGSMNHLAILGTEYLELIAVPRDEPRRSDILDAPIGLNGLVFGTENADAVFEALHANGVPVLPANRFSRPVELPGGERRDASFATVRLAPEATDVGRLYFCQHFTRDLVWRDAWRHHPNGAIGVIRAVIAADDPGAIASLFSRMFGPDAVRGEGGERSLSIGLSRFDVVTPARLRADFGAAAADQGGRSAFMAALTLRTRSLAQAAASFAGEGIQVEASPDRLVIPHGSAFGVAIEFRE